MTTKTRISDKRAGTGRANPGEIRMPTHQVPVTCLCSWVIARPGPGTACVSELKYRNNLCPARHPAAEPRGIGLAL